MKVCKLCGEAKPVEDFVKNKAQPDGLHTYCKRCHNEKCRQWSRKNPEKRRQLSARWRAENMGYSRRWQLKRRYNITEDDYQRLLDDQGQRCAICKSPNGHNDRPLVVDHDHSTGQVRGLLCDSCNTAIGHFKEDIDALQGAIKYLSQEAG